MTFPLLRLMNGPQQFLDKSLVHEIPILVHNNKHELMQLYVPKTLVNWFFKSNGTPRFEWFEDDFGYHKTTCFHSMFNPHGKSLVNNKVRCK